MSDKVSPFDFVNSVSFSKEDLMSKEGGERGYVPYLVNKALSQHLDSVMYANDMNYHHTLDHRLQYDYLLNTIRPRKRYGKWAKPFDSEDLKMVQRVYKCGRTVAIQTLSLLSEADLKMIRTRYDEGGVSGSKK